MEDKARELARWERFHRSAVAVCAMWASVRTEFRLDLHLMVSFLEKFMCVWSGYIVVASFVKLGMERFGVAKPIECRPARGERASQANSTTTATASDQGPPAWRQHVDLLTLNYLPCVNDFATLYYGLMLTSIGGPLMWTLYLNYYRPAERRAQDAREGLAAAAANSGYAAGAPAEGLPPQLPAPVSAGGRAAGRACARCSVAQFFLAGPRAAAAEPKPRQPPDGLLRDIRLGVARELGMDAGWGQKNLLTLQYGPRGSRSIGRRQQQRLQQARPSVEEADALKSGDRYVNLIRRYHFLGEGSLERWLYQARVFYWVLVAFVAASIPTMYLTMSGLGSVRTLFGLPLVVAAPTNAAGPFASPIEPHLVHIYGLIEQVYACCQAAVLFFYTNLFVALFSAELSYRFRHVANSSRSLCKAYENGERRRTLVDYASYILAGYCLGTKSKRGPRPREAQPQPLLVAKNQPPSGQQQASQIQQNNEHEHEDEAELDRREALRDQSHELQLQLWAYFDQVRQLDEYVSRFSLMSIFTFSAGICLGQNYLIVTDWDLQLGSAAVLVTNYTSFTYLYLWSWYLERQTTHIYRTLCSICSRENDLIVRRNWKRIFTAFYEEQSIRTFSFHGRYPLNLRSYFKTLFGFVTMSIILHRVFQRNNWDLTANR